MSRKKLTKKIENFVLKKLSEGISIAECCRKYPEQTGHLKDTALYMKSLRDTEFADKLNQAYSCYYMIKSSELDRLSTGLASELYPDAEFREAEAALKRRIDALKFDLGKMAPILSKRFDKTQKIELEGANLGPQILIMDYSTNEKIEKSINNLIEDGKNK